MALLTNGAAALVTFDSPTGPDWQALASQPGYPSGSALAAAVINGTALAIYVVDASSGTFAFPGGLASGFDDTIVNVATSGFTMTVNPVGGSPVVWVKIGLAVWTYGATGILESIPGAEATALKAFLP